MFFRSINRCVLSSLSLGFLSFGLLSCGGGGGNSDGERLPPGAMLDLDATLASVNDQNANKWNVLIKVVGNGSDVPGVSINAAGTNDKTAMTSNIFQYRRTGASASLKGNFSIMSGQWTAPGPTVITNKDKVFVNVTISFNESDEHKTCAGSFTGSVVYEVPAGLNVQVADVWSATEGTVAYSIVE